MADSRRRRVLLACLAGGIVAAVRPARAVTPVLVDHLSGLAIGGYDPVEYFLRGAPHPGRAEFETRWGGAVWRFDNDGNRQAFLTQPAIYAPRFGGYDPVRAADGFVAEGDPLLFTVFQNRLYLCHSVETLRAFAADYVGTIARADRNWPTLVANWAQ